MIMLHSFLTPLSSSLVSLPLIRLHFSHTFYPLPLELLKNRVCHSLFGKPVLFQQAQGWSLQLKCHILQNSRKYRVSTLTLLPLILVLHIVPKHGWAILRKTMNNLKNHPIGTSPSSPALIGEIPIWRWSRIRNPFLFPSKSSFRSWNYIVQ